MAILLVVLLLVNAFAAGMVYAYHFPRQAESLYGWLRDL